VASRLSLLREENVLDSILSRQREAARLLAVGTTNLEVAAQLGYHPAYIPRLKKDIAPAIEVYNRARDEATVTSVRESIDKGAKDGLVYLLRILEAETPENKEASHTLKVKVAQDFLDREGSAPKVTSQRGDQKHLHMHVTPDDLQKLRDAKNGKLREKYAKQNTADAQLASLEADSIS
jgi:hypothetical protein